VLQANGQPCPAVGSSPSAAATVQTPAAPSVSTPPPATTAQSPATRPSSSTVAAATGKFVDRQSDSQYLASNLMGKSVQNSAGDKVGTVKDIMFDDQGKMNAIIIGVGGFLGIGEKSVGIPFDMIKTNKDANGNLIVVASFDKDAINTAPDFVTLEDAKVRAPSGTPTAPRSP
jgi:sporulation protein YlmC with PRC-barrel domain